MRSLDAVVGCVGAIALSACASEDTGRRPTGGVTVTGGGITSAGSGTGLDDEGGGGSRGSGGSGSDSGASGEDDDVLLDVAPATGGFDPCPDGGCKKGCTAVDLLFVVDNSISMAEEQEALSEAFPAFADAIVESLPPGINLHVAVTSTTFGVSNLGNTFNCDATGEGGRPAADFYVTPDVTQNNVNGGQGRLYNAEGLYYYDIDTDAPPDELANLAAWFSSAAQIGEGGSQIEMATAAAAWAASPVNAPTNTGFIRDEGAVLVLFFIQDEPDQTPMGLGPELVQMITDAKAECGGMECVVGGGLVNQLCLSVTPIGELFAAFSKPAVVAALPENPPPSVFEPVLRDALSQVIAETCTEIPVPQG